MFFLVIFQFYYSVTVLLNAVRKKEIIIPKICLNAYLLIYITSIIMILVWYATNLTAYSTVIFGLFIASLLIGYFTPVELVEFHKFDTNSFDKGGMLIFTNAIKFKSKK